MTRAPLALCLALFACGPTTMVGSQPSWRHSNASETAAPAAAVVGPIKFTPTTPAAARYNEPVEAPPSTPLGDALLVAVHEAADQAHLPAPIADARLFRASAELAAAPSPDLSFPPALVAFVLQRNGLIEPMPRLMVLSGPPIAPAAVIDELRPQLADALANGIGQRVGIGTAVHGGDEVVVFMIQDTPLSTRPIPRTLPPDGSARIDGAVDAHYQTPELFITHDDGNTEGVALTEAEGGAIHTTVPCAGHRGKQQVEVTANGKTGPTTLALFPVWCGNDPPIEFEWTPRADKALSAGDVQQQLFALINRDRTTRGLAKLGWDSRVADVARSHSEEMQRTHIVGHVSPATGAATDRVRSAGIKTILTLENVALSYNVEDAHDSLMSSPGHRANILSARATHVGIGVVLGDESAGRREMFLTEDFILIAPRIERARAVETVVQRVMAARRVPVDALLSEIAQQLADGLAAGKTGDQLWPTARARLEKAGGAYVKVSRVITAVADVAAIDGKDLLAAYTPDAMGVGVAQGPHPVIGDSAVWIVALLAERAKK